MGFIGAYATVLRLWPRSWESRGVVHNGTHASVAFVRTYTTYEHTESVIDLLGI